MTIEMKAMAKVENVNSRKEGPDGARTLAVDVKITANVNKKVLATILCVSNSEAIDTLWQGEDSDPAFWVVMSMNVSDDVHFDELIAEVGGEKFYGAEARKFKVRPRGGGTADITFNLVVREPSEHLLAHLHEQIKEEVRVEIEPDQRDAIAETFARAPEAEEETA